MKIPLVELSFRLLRRLYKLTKMDVAANIGVKYIVVFYSRCDEVWRCEKALLKRCILWVQRDIVVMQMEYYNNPG